MGFYCLHTFLVKHSLGYPSQPIFLILDFMGFLELGTLIFPIFITKGVFKLFAKILVMLQVMSYVMVAKSFIVGNAISVMRH